MQCYANTDISCHCMSVCVRHMPVLYQNGCTGRAGFLHAGFPRLMLHYVSRKLGYLENKVLPSGTKWRLNYHMDERVLDMLKMAVVVLAGAIEQTVLTVTVVDITRAILQQIWQHRVSSLDGYGVVHGYESCSN